ncbi:hypothetical protein AB0B28_02420 [Glycomyces sp. NPDC046736]|uniref:hypothetical protein n=1 Tax=Glycomyces sp. NPDC046736 TaxID=3155615 RepID=UPI0033DF7984
MTVDTLTARAEIGQRQLTFQAIFSQHRLRVVFTGMEPPVLGSVVYLDTDQPGLRISTPLHVEWAARHHEAIIEEAKRIWGVAIRECDG